MAFESLKAEIALLLTAIKDQPQDKHELYLEIMQKLNELKAYGMPLPEDLVELERHLEHEFAAAHRPGTLNIPLNGSFLTWAGWLIPYDRDFYVITDRLDDVKRALELIGLDRIAGHYATFAAQGGHLSVGGGVAGGIAPGALQPQPLLTPAPAAGREQPAQDLAQRFGAGVQGDALWD